MRFTFTVISILLLTGCDANINSIGSTLSQLFSQAVSLLSGQTDTSSQATTEPSPSPSPMEEEFSSTAARSAKANAEIMREILQVVLMREPKDRSEFGNWVDTLNQGASLEGVYNGLTHSADFRKLETEKRSATVEALRAFSEELVQLEIELPRPTKFDQLSSSPLPDDDGKGSIPTKALAIDLDRQEAANPTPSASPARSAAELQAMAENYAKQFVGSSIFTLKRILGDEALKVIEHTQGTPGPEGAATQAKLATWYSKWVVRIAQRNIDFGISLRNKPDEMFHYKWAISNSQDRMKWEVLNRLHRVLNEANRQKQ